MRGGRGKREGERERELDIWVPIVFSAVSDNQLYSLPLDPSPEGKSGCVSGVGSR